MTYFFPVDLAHISICFIISYFLGSIPFGLILSKMMKIGDIRKIGSKNIGATNVLRSGNKLAAALTLILDSLKGYCAVVICGHFFGLTGTVFSGIFAVCGHCFPVWLKFRGGKGVAVGSGIFSALSPTISFLCTLTWLVFFIPLRYSSLASVIAAIAAPILFYLFDMNEYVNPVIIISLIVISRHWINISRIIRGKETKISFMNKK